MSTKIDFHLNPDSRLDAKWLKTDLEEALKKNMVPHYWNELLKDNELIVHGCVNTKRSSGSVNGNFMIAPSILRKHRFPPIWTLLSSILSDASSSCRATSADHASCNKKLKSDVEHFGIGCERSQRIIDSWAFSKTNGNDSVKLLWNEADWKSWYVL